jgi:hypothetical protein
MGQAAYPVLSMTDDKQLLPVSTTNEVILMFNVYSALCFVDFIRASLNYPNEWTKEGTTAEEWKQFVGDTSFLFLSKWGF